MPQRVTIQEGATIRLESGASGVTKKPISGVAASSQYGIFSVKTKKLGVVKVDYKSVTVHD